MCGIAGQFNYLHGAPVDEMTLGRMCELLAHRGPDGSGVYHSGSIGLAHRRLAIIDLSDAGRQPMSSEDGVCWITFNGEIYNFQELRDTLEAAGHRFRTRTDTEVILAAYAEYGVDCVTRLDGMFAFAIWDSRARRLMLARDRTGKKPLCYWSHEQGISFASEPKAFLGDVSFPRRVNRDAIAAYLALQYVPAPLSAFEGVAKLPPAHYALIDESGVRLQRYWSLRYTPKQRLSEDEAVAGLGDHLRRAVKKRLVSDVPLGAFLSGGIDSSLVVALMSEQGTGTVRTFSIGFDDAAYNELEYARAVARRYETEHHEHIVRPNALDVLPDLVWFYNEPFADSSAIPSYYLAKMTRQHVTVALNGDGGDESFAGYQRYLANIMAGRLSGLPLAARRLLSHSARAIPARLGRSASRAKRFIGALAETPENRYVRWMCHFDRSELPALCSPEFLSGLSLDPFAPMLATYAATDAPDFIDATLDVDVQHYLPGDLLVKMDIATMAHGLEARSPFLDRDVMEFSATLSSDMKLHGTTKKHLLKKFARQYLPAEIVDRPKMGFGVPLQRWLATELRDLTRDLLLGSRFRERGYFDPAYVRGLLREPVTGRRTWQVWNLLLLELWHREFIDNAGRQSAMPTRRQPCTTEA
jgi:asparagine synthase (glutamine-hydrolysing)